MNTLPPDALRMSGPATVRFAGENSQPANTETL
jgi:hypothetical protein